MRVPPPDESPEPACMNASGYQEMLRFSRRAMLIGGAIALSTLSLSSCSPPATSAPATTTALDAPASLPEATQAATAKVTQVSVVPESAGTYRFTVTVESPDTGCDRYANWWELVTPSGELISRRVLAHSHVEEQPFSRSLGDVAVAAEDPIIVRSHMHPTGYSPLAMAGSIRTGFESVTLPINFAAGLDDAEPLPAACAF